MIDKNNWITQGTKISWKHKSNRYAFTKKSNDPKVKALCTKYCEIPRKAILEAKQQQHRSILIAISDNKISTT